MVGFNRNKFGNRKNKDKPTIDGHVFGSEPEYHRYIHLKSEEKAGVIKDLVVHPKFILAKGVKNEHGQRVSQWAYTADSMYTIVESGVKCVEDVKSLRIDKNGKKHGTSQSRDYKLTRNEFMRQNPDILFREIY